MCRRKTKVLVKKINIQKANIHELKAKKQHFKIQLEKSKSQPVEKGRKSTEVLLSSLVVKYVGTATIVPNIAPKICSKRTCVLGPFSSTMEKR